MGAEADLSTAAAADHTAEAHRLAQQKVGSAAGR